MTSTSPSPCRLSNRRRARIILCVQSRKFWQFLALSRFLPYFGAFPSVFPFENRGASARHSGGVAPKTNRFRYVGRACVAAAEKFEVCGGVGWVSLGYDSDRRRLDSFLSCYHVLSYWPEAQS